MADAKTLKIDGQQALKTLGELKQEAADLAKQLDNCVIGTEEFANTSKKLQSVNTLLEGLNQTSVQLGDNILKVSTGIVGGFQVAQGAMALFGTESEAVQKSILKMTALMSLSQGIKGVMEGVKSFKLLATSIKAAATASKGLKVALASTGIGLLVVAVGELIAHFDDIKNFFSGSGSAARDASKDIEQYNDAIARANQEWARAEKLQRAEGATELELAKQRRDNALATLKHAQNIADQFTDRESDAYKEAQKNLESAHQEWLNALTDVQVEEKKIKNKQREDEQKADEEALKKKEEKEKEASNKRIERAKQEAETLKKIRNEALNEATDKFVENEQAMEQYNVSARQNELDELNKKKEDTISAYEKLGQDTTALVEYYRKLEADINKKYDDEEKANTEAKKQEELNKLGINNYLTEEETQLEHLNKMQANIEEAHLKGLISEEQYANAKKKLEDEVTAYKEQAIQTQIANAAQAANGLGNILGSIASMVDTNSEEGFEAAKKLQIAQATINMITGIATALSGAFTTKTGPWDIALAAIQAASIAAAGIANIAKIKNTKFDGGGSATASTSAVNSTLVAPTQFSQEVTNAKLEENVGDTKVYVTESDIQRTTKKVSVAESESRY